MKLRTGLLLGAVALAAAHCLWFSGFTVDDGAISFSYARSLAHGDGAVIFPGGERVEGYTNFLWVALLAFGMRLGGDPFFLSHFFGLLLCVGATLATAALCARLRGREEPIDAIAAMLVALLPPVAYWSMSGLEGGLYAALVVTTAATLLREEDEAASFEWSALCAAGCALTRPDGLSVLILAAAYRLLRGPRRRSWLFFALLPVAGFFAWRYAYYAWLWPNTFYAKVQEPFRLRELVEFRALGWSYVLGLVARYRLWALAVLSALVLWPGARWPRRAFVVALLAAMVFFPIYARGDWMSEGRFLVAGLPLLCALAVIGPEVVLGDRRWNVAPIALAACVVVPICIAHSRERRGNYPVPAAHVAERGRHYKELAERYQITPRSALDGDLGGTSYYSGMPIVDLGMLADVTLARYRHDPSVEREYVHGERRPSFMRLAGFWLEDGLQTYAEYTDHYLPSGMADITIDRRAFLEWRIDPRRPLIAGTDGVDVLGVYLGDHLDAWLRVTREPPLLAPELRTQAGVLNVSDRLFPPARWHKGEVVHVRLARPAGPLRICAGQGEACALLVEGANGTQPVLPPRPTVGLIERATARGELELALAAKERLAEPTTLLGRRFYDRAERARKEGDSGRAFRDYGLALRADPSLSFARRHLEALRLEPRAQYRYRYEERLEAAQRELMLAPDAERLGLIATLASIADRPRFASDAYLATRLIPSDASARLALAECLARDGLAEEAVPLFPIVGTSPVERVRIDALADLLALDPTHVDSIARSEATVSGDAALPRRNGSTQREVGLATSATPATQARKPLGPGLELVDTSASLAPSGSVLLQLVVRGNTASSALQIGARTLSFDRAPSSWGKDERFVEEVELALPPGESPLHVGSVALTAVVQPFTQDFENGRLDGWTADGDAFTDAPTRWRASLHHRGFEGHYFLSSHAGGDARVGTLRSPPLRDGVDEVCFVVGGGKVGAGVRIEPGDAPPAHGENDWNLREACLPAHGGARIVVFDEGRGAWQHVAADDFSCFSRGRPVACAGDVQIR